MLGYITVGYGTTAHEASFKKKKQQFFTRHLLWKMFTRYPEKMNSLVPD